MSRTLIIGVDCGASGGFAELWPDGKVDCFPMFSEDNMRDYFEQIARHPDLGITNVAVWMEQVGGYIGRPQSGAHMFVFGAGFGFIRGIIMANRLPLNMVRPQVWSKGIASVKGLKGPERKRALREEAARQFPNVKVTLKTCDALLIAAYGRQQQIS